MQRQVPDIRNLFVFQKGRSAACWRGRKAASPPRIGLLTDETGLICWPVVVHSSTEVKSKPHGGGWEGNNGKAGLKFARGYVMRRFCIGPGEARFI